MRCPFCGNIDTQVKDSRPAEDHVSIRRRRFCSACGGRFTTYDRVQLRDLVVIKSNGRREDFEREKLERSIATKISIKKGEIITEDMLHLLSPGDGFKWAQKDLVIGKEAKVDIFENELIYSNMI